MSNNIREDCGSSKIAYFSPHWDRICEYYFKRSGFDIQNFHGDVLYVGMGGAYGPRNQSKNVKSTTILEKYPEIIQKNKIIQEDWNIIEADAYEYDFKDKKFDFIVLDIWAKYINKQEYNILFPKFRKYLKKFGKIYTIKTLRIK